MKTEMKMRDVYRITVEKVRFWDIQKGDLFVLLDPSDPKWPHEDGKTINRARTNPQLGTEGLARLETETVGFLTEPIHLLNFKEEPMTTREARKRLKSHFPIETVEDYEDYIVIVSRSFDGQSEEEREKTMRELVPDYTGCLILRTPAEVMDQVLHPCMGPTA